MAAVLTSCPNCGVELATQDYDSESIGRCANCGSQFGLDARLKDLTTKNHKATLSAVLGIASFLGLFVTGIPAVILGWLALKAIREKKTKGGRQRAITGMITGSVFSLLCGTSVVGFAVFAYSVIPSEDPADLKAAQEELGTWELPTEVSPDFTNSTFGMRTLAHQDDGRKSRVLVVLYPRSLAPTKRAALSQAESMKISLTLKKVGTFTVEGENGPIEVTEESGTDDDGEAIRAYSAAIPHPGGWVVILVQLKERPSDESSNTAGADNTDEDDDKPYYMTIEEVKRVFETFQPPAK